MSMVGYVLGLGDRHPSNLMLERASGKVLHIDFGDCFEVAMHRDKYPEKIPFRLTRMLNNALEVCGVEGYFRHTCEAVMGVLRREKASLMAMLEAFVHDPLINWRLLGVDPAVAAQPKRTNSTAVGVANMGASVHAAALDAYRPVASESVAVSGSLARQMIEAGQLSLAAVAAAMDGAGAQRGRVGSTDGNGPSEEKPPPGSIVGSVARKSISHTVRARLMGEGGGASDFQSGQGESSKDVIVTDALNRRAVAAIQRVSNKLNGRDFDYDEVLDVDAQVQRLIEEATNVENLCQCYIGWCAFW